jgi:hypothetical protein
MYVLSAICSVLSAAKRREEKRKKVNIVDIKGNSMVNLTV